MSGVDVPRGGIFDGAIVTGDASSYWGPPARMIGSSPSFSQVPQVPGFSQVPVAAYPVMPVPFGAVSTPLPASARRLTFKGQTAAHVRRGPQAWITPRPQSSSDAAANASAAQSSAVTGGLRGGRRPTALQSIYSAELLGRGAGIFEGSVLQCPTAEGAYVPARGGIFDGPNFGEQCMYADRTRATIPQDRPAEQPIEMDSAVRPIGISGAPDGLGIYRTWRR